MLTNYRTLALAALVITSPLLLNAADPEPSGQSSANQDELNAIENEIHRLKNELQEYRKKALSNEVHAQPLMFDNWHQYAEDIRLSEEDEKHISTIKARIAALNERKQAILKNHPAP